MLVAHRWLFAVWVMVTAVGCTSGAGCGGFVSQPPGTYQGPKVDSAGAVRVSQHGFDTLSANGGSALLKLLAPGGNLDTTVSCSTQAFLGETFAISDQGSLGCTDESCGRGDGKCGPLDVPEPVSIAVGGLTLDSASPDLIEANLTATVKTGDIIISSTKRSSVLCLFSGPVKCAFNFDSTRQQPVTNVMTVQLKLAIRNGLLSIELADLAGTKACSGAANQECIDPGDILVSQITGGCASACSTLNTSLVKQLLIDQLTKSLKTQLTKSLNKVTCQPCANGTDGCPTNAACVVDAATDAGTCIEAAGGRCSPRFLGLEGRADLGTSLASFGVPASAALDVSLALGGSATAEPKGASIGMRGGLKEVMVAPCVTPLAPVALPNLPLPNFDLDGPAQYDLAFSLSEQLVSQTLFHAQQSGALCLEIGTETVTQLDSATLETFLPSLKVFSHGANVPMRVVIRPVNPPTAVIGAGTLDAQGKPLDPLIKLNWPGVEIDMYAKLEERLVRVFTISADLELPIGLSLSGCGSLKPVIGDLMNAVKKVEVKNSELLSEDLTIIAKLVPTLLTLAEPALAKGLPSVALPSLGSTIPFQVKLLQTRGVGQVSGTMQYNHLGIYAALVNADGGCN